VSGLQQADAVAARQQTSAVASRQRLKPQVHKPVDLWHCLIASARPAHRQWLAEVGRQWGWDVSVCGTSADAQRSLGRLRPQLAFVDVQGPEGEAFCAVAEQIAGECQTLLVVCGNEEDGPEEIWIRELGAWFYLPGMQLGASVALLFRDARSIVEKQAGQWLPESPRGEVLLE
jgi:hypothetical protein